MEQPILKAQAIGQLLLMQSIIAGLPDEASIFSFACRGLQDIPGVSSVRYSPDQDTSPLPDVVRLPLAVGTTCLGELILELSDPVSFTPYLDYLNNFCFMMAVILEERKQRSQNQIYQSRLEKMVEDRTFRLREEIAKNKVSEERFRELFNNMSNGAAIYEVVGDGEDFIISDLNTAARKITQVEDDFVGRSVRDVFPGVVGYGLFDVFQNVWHTGIAASHPTALYHDNELAFWAENYVFKLPSGQVVAIFDDVTQHKKAEIEVYAAGQLWRSTFDAMLDPVAYLSTDGSIEKCNRAFADYLGLDIRTIKGCKCHQLIHDSSKHIDGCPLVRARQSKTRETMELETDRGSIFVAVDPVKDGDGQVIGFVHIMRDITEQRKSHQAMEESKKRYQLVAETAHDFILTTDLYYNITFANKAVENLMGGNSPVGLKLNDFTPPHNLALGEEMMAKRRSGVSDIFSFEWELTYTAGRSSILDIRSQLLTEDGKPSGVLFVARDITERKKAEEDRIKLEKQLFEAQKMEAVGTLAGGIAHDFNNILAAVMGYAELLRDEHYPGKRKENLERLLLAAERAKDLVNQILAFSRRVEHDKKPIDLKLVIKEEIKLLRATMPKTIEIRQNIADKAFTVFADVTQMHQIVMNLCTNAAYAMGEKGGILNISLSREHMETNAFTNEHHLNPGTYVKLSISDTGPGIAFDVISRIFEPFFTTKKIGEGTGLGLSVVYGIVKNHDGTVQVESSPGTGATFHIYLPFIEETERLNKVLPDHGIPHGKERILFIDDEPDLTQLAQASLSRLGYQVTAVSDSREALTLFQTNPDAFDLIITDMTMPHLSGSDLAQEVIKLRPEQSIILCTGYSSYIDAEKAARMGIKSFLLKPVSRQDLANAVRKTLDEVHNTGTLH